MENFPLDEGTLVEVLDLERTRNNPNYSSYIGQIGEVRRSWRDSRGHFLASIRFSDSLYLTSKTMYTWRVSPIPREPDWVL